MQKLFGLLIVLAQVLSNWRAVDAAALPALVDALYDNALCTGVPSLTPLPGQQMEATLLDFCYYSPVGGGFSKLTELTTYNPLTDVVTTTAHLDKECNGPDVSGGLDTFVLGSQPCVSVGSGRFSKKILTSVNTQDFTGLADWSPNDFSGATSSTCFPEISDLGLPSSGSGSSGHFLAGSCFATPNPLFSSISVSSGTGTFADVTTHQTTDCTGAGTPLNGCIFVSAFNRTFFAGDLSELTPFPTTSPSPMPTEAPSTSPTFNPTRDPTTLAPSSSPTFNPTGSPSGAATLAQAFTALGLSLVIGLSL